MRSSAFWIGWLIRCRRYLFIPWKFIHLLGDWSIRFGSTFASQKSLSNLLFICDAFWAVPYTHAHTTFSQCHAKYVSFRSVDVDAVGCFWCGCRCWCCLTRTTNYETQLLSYTDGAFFDTGKPTARIDGTSIYQTIYCDVSRRRQPFHRSNIRQQQEPRQQF